MNKRIWMTININEDGEKIVMDVMGLIKGVTDSQRLKDAIESIQNKRKYIEINIHESFAVNSTIVGYLRKKIKIDGLSISVRVKDERLYELFDELKLLDIFNVSRL